MDMKNWLQGFEILAIIGGATWALLQWGMEFQWKRAKLAWDLTDKIHEDAEVRPALLLLDGESNTVTADGTTYEVEDGDITEALEQREGRFLETPKARAIRTPFDALFYAFERLAHAIQLKLLTEEDVFAPTKYYAGFMAGQQRYRDYAEYVGYKQAIDLIDRLGTTRQAAPARQRAGGQRS
jgi:hypothetical protein